MLEQLLSHLEKKNIRQGATLRIEEEHGNLKGYDSTTTKFPVVQHPWSSENGQRGTKTPLGLR